MSEKEQQFERIYKETESFGRTQFVREIQMQINDNKKKDKEVERLNNLIDEIYMFLSQYTITHTWQKIVIEDTIKYIEELKRK